MTIIVKKKPGQSDQQLVSDFRKITRYAGIVDEVKDNKRYLKPSAQRRKDKKERERKMKISERRK